MHVKNVLIETYLCKKAHSAENIVYFNKL